MQTVDDLEKVSTIHDEIVNDIESVPEEDFIANAIEQLAKTLNVRYAFITECTDLTLTKVRTLYFWDKDHFIDNVEYETTETPCEKVISGEVCYYPEDIQALFPRDQDLVDLDAAGYAATPLVNSNNEVIGHLVILNQQKLNNKETIEYTLKVYAFRLAIELEKQYTQKLNKALTVREKQKDRNPFEQLAESIGKLLNVDFVLISHQSDFSLHQLKSLAIYNNGIFLEPIDFPLEDTPCETVFGKSFQAYTSNVQSLFPKISLLKHLDVEAYLGTPLFDSNNRAIGLLAVMHKQAIKNTARIKQILETFAQQVTYEIERKHNEEYVQYYNSIISSSDDLMSFIDTDYTYRFVNESYRRVTDKPLEEIVGHKVVELHGEEVFYGGLKDIIDESLQEKPILLSSGEHFQMEKADALTGITTLILTKMEMLPAYQLLPETLLK